MFMKSKAPAKVYAYNLVADKKTCYAELEDWEREELTGLLLETKGKIEAYDYISDADYNCELPFLLAKYMQTKSDKLGDEILQFLKDNASRTMARQIDELLKEQAQELEFDMKYDYQEA